MKKTLLSALILSILCQIYAYKFEYTFEKPSIINHRIEMQNCVANFKAFEPNVAIKPVSLLLPYNQRAVSMQISYTDPITLEGEYLIDPVYPSGRLSVIPSSSEKKYSPVFQNDTFYPEITRDQKFTMQYKNGHPILISMLYPVQYNPISKKIRYYTKICVDIQTENYTNQLYKHNSAIANQIKQVINNQELLSTYPNTQRNIDDYDYLIITTNTYENHFSNFIDFNLQRGLKSSLTLKQSIIDQIPGFDIQDKIRNYIKQEYLEHNISFVLLAGDNELLPHRGFRSEINDYGTDYYDETDMPADMYFACLDGTWKNEDSEYFGESGSEDLMYEVYVSRFAIDSLIELNNMINKTINYSLNPVTESIQNNLLVGEHLWGPPQFEIDTYGQAYMDQFIGECSAYNYSTQGFTSEWTNSTQYDFDYTWDAETLLLKINTDKPVWIDHLGHSNVTYNMRFSDYDVNSINFQNNGINANFFIIYSQGCYSGSFDNRTTQGNILDTDCIGEKFTTVSTAASAYIGNARYGLGSPYDINGSGQVFHRYFHHALFNNHIHSVELMNAFSKEISAPLILENDITLPPYFGQCKWIAYGLNVLGDPALSLWTTQPQNLNPVLSDTIYTNTDYIIQTQAFARIIFYNESKTYIFSGIADSLGFYNLSQENPDLNLFVSQNPNDIYFINIKADNYYPFQITLHTQSSSLDHHEIIPILTKLNNYPNPFNPNTHICFNLSAPATIKLSIYNLKGQKVKSLINENLNSGNHNIRWDGSDDNHKLVGSGLYFYKLEYDNKIINKKMLLIK